MKFTKTQQNTFWILFLIGLLVNVEKGLVGVIVPYLRNPEYMGRLGLTAWDPATIGLLTSLFYLSFILMTFGTGWLVDKYGYRRFIPPCLFALTVGAFCFGLAGFTSGAMAILLMPIARMVVGLGMAAYTNGTPPVIAGNFAPEQRGAIQGRVLATAGLGAILCYLVINPFLAAKDFRIIYFGLAVLFFLAMLLFLKFVPNPKPADNSVASASAKTGSAASAKDSVKFSEAWKNRNTLVLALALLLNNAVAVALLNWATDLYVTEFKIHAASTELLIVMVGRGVVVLVATWTVADLIKRFFKGQERLFLLGCSLTGMLFLVGMVAFGSFWGSAICLWLASLAIMFAFGSLLILPYQTIPVRIIGSAFAIINIGAFIGGIFQGYGIGLLVKLTGGYYVAFVVMAVMLLVQGLIPFLLDGKNPNQPVEK